ncbi:hypothetical protein B0T16DRAFT_410910 [Cercophora newfieldiana]|uniref:SMODS and SLOG-associating 2TM effector domain-containing protein n=1 Tax=Cercophora newfieldiana TaxID=92897 RepID=A0AA39YCC2_9PEZI|nr:hypothetical protein B0T16DRAFT_410910 [Cercophora newfieldiana]
MASFMQAAMRLMSSKPRAARPRPDEEQGVATSSLATSSTQGAYSQQEQAHPAGYSLTSSDDLTVFRLMLGITVHPNLGFEESRARPADNIGLYARVVHSEQVAKDSYKVFSAVINACYGLQIILAAALTALGAANADNKAITAFGALNTVIAGFLTYLKGSGLPARLKYFGNEWKKVREYIEQRERDFSHEGCTLDVHEVVDTIRAMYNNTKREIEINTPDSYNSMTNMRAPAAGADAPAVQDVAGKLKSLETTVQRLKAGVEKTETSVKGAVDTVREEGKHAVADIKSFGRSLHTEKEIQGPK